VNCLLDSNDLKGQLRGLSNSWGALKGLKVLALSHNNLEGPLPVGLGEVATLKVLNLSCNKLTGPIPEEWGKLRKLTHFWAFANSIEGPPLPKSMASVTGCTLLESVRLRRNLLDGEIVGGVGSLERLKELDLEENMIPGQLPSTLTKLTALRALRLANNNLEGALPVDLLGVLTKLKDLRLYHNKLASHTASDWVAMRTVSKAKEL